MIKPQTHARKGARPESKVPGGQLIFESFDGASALKETYFGSPPQSQSSNSHPMPLLFAGNTWVLEFQDPHSLGFVVFSDVRSFCQKVGQNGFSTLSGAPNEDLGLQQLSPGPTRVPLESTPQSARSGSHRTITSLSYQSSLCIP